jgi:hypothetical protein
VDAARGRARLTGVLHDDVALLVLVVTQGQQDDVALVDPDLLPQLAADMCEAARAVEALGLETAVAEHLDDLGILLALLLEDELALLVVVLVLTPAPVLTTLLCVSAAGHRGRGSPAGAAEGRTFPLFLGMMTVGEAVAV